jgi:hypothetical protein
LPRENRGDNDRAGRNVNRLDVQLVLFEITGLLPNPERTISGRKRSVRDLQGLSVSDRNAYETADKESDEDFEVDT